MSKKLFIGVVPLIAAVALAVTPMAAQALEGHYFSGGLGAGSRIAPTEKVATIAWGTLSLTNLTTGGKVECHNVIGAVEENPAPGGEAGPAGVGETQSFNPYECESPQCTAASTGGGPATYISVFAEGTEVPFPNTGNGHLTHTPNLATEEPQVSSGTNVKWKNVLINEGTKVRQESTGVRVNVICHVMTGLNGKGEPFYGTQVPEVSLGGNKPLGVVKCCTPLSPPELSFDAGSGTLETEISKQKGKTEGSLKTLGYNLEEVINAKQG